MSNAEMPKESAVEPFAATVDMKLEVVSGSAQTGLPGSYTNLRN
jgi:hypothetical protein